MSLRYKELLLLLFLIWRCFSNSKSQGGLSAKVSPSKQTNKQTNKQNQKQKTKTNKQNKTKTTGSRNKKEQKES